MSIGSGYSKSLYTYTPDCKGVVGNCHPMLRLVFLFACTRLYYMYGKRFIITSIKRDDPDSVHNGWRGIDVDVCDKRHYEGGVLPHEARTVVAITNQVFKYNPDVPRLNVAVYGKNDPSGRHDNHIHFQARKETEMRWLAG
jgi:hypothetical protein